MTAPLQDVRVVEIAHFVAAPAGGALLADLGAQVIKVEIPQGEVMRHSRPRHAGFRSDFPEAPHFHMDNRGKRSLPLDLNRPEGLAALQRVIENADVVLTNMLPARLARFGLDAASLRARDPGLIVASLSGYGADGPEADTPAFDYTAYWARTGLMDQMHEPDAAPAYLRPGVGDHAASLALVTGILAALRVRERTGVGQEVEVNLMHLGFYVQGNDAAMTLTTGLEPPRHDRHQPRNPLWNHYQTQDDRWLFLVMIESDRYWPALCKALHHPEWEHDPRFAGAVPRYRNSEALTRLLAGTFRSQSLADWEMALGAAGLIWAPVRTLGEAVEDPQAQAMGMFAEVHHAALPGLRTVTAPLRLSQWPMRGELPAPPLGGDAEALLREAGLGEEEIRGALAGPTPSSS